MERAPSIEPKAPVHYPESDGQPMASNTEQYDLIVKIKEGCDATLPNAFVAGDLLWYPVRGHPDVRAAPDVLVAIGRPKGRRGSYRTWAEAGVDPQVVFEIWSPGNTFAEQVEKLRFYERHRVQEFYLFDPDREEFSAWMRTASGLDPVPTAGGWTSPLLGIRMEQRGRDLLCSGPDGELFLSPLELKMRADAAKAAADAAKAEADAAKAEADAAKAEADAAKAERDTLRAKLRAAGLDPDAL